MKRRDFIKFSSLAVPAAMAGSRAVAQTSAPYRYPSPNRLDDVVTQSGDILLRLKFSSAETKQPVLHEGKVRVENADVAAITRHNFEAVDDFFDPTAAEFRLRAHKNNPDILLVRLRHATGQTRLSVAPFATFSLTEILQSGYLKFENSAGRLDVNFLLDFEIGAIDLKQIGVNENPDNFNFHIFADPQGGAPLHPQSHRTRMRIHNAFIEDSIVLANFLPERPLFTLILGDIVDSQGQVENFEVMHKFFQDLDSPILYELGNHESKYSATFEPGYDMSAFTNYFNAQKKLNGMEKILYSFNVGKWHFVVWPDPLRSFFWDNHPHYFEWLARDLEKHKDRPTLIFQHVPVHPIGIDPFQGYLEPVSVRRTFVDTVTKHGNVRAVLSGHVHIPVKSSLKVACSIRGTNFITLPAAGYRPRGFGEQDYFGGPTQGIAIVNINGDKETITFKTVMEEELTYPEKCPELDVDRYKLWFSNKWEIETKPHIQNGDFRNGLDGWIPEYVYQEDENPSVICETREIGDRSALYLYNRIRGYQAPGQDRLPQTINRISQAVRVQPGKTPSLRFQYKLDKVHCDLDGFCGGYVWIEGYDKSYRQFNLVYSAGTAFASPIAKWTDKIHDVHHFELQDSLDWAEAALNIQEDLESREDRKYAELKIDLLVFTIGVWTLNEGTDQPFGWYLMNFILAESGGPSTVNGELVPEKPVEKIWWRGKHMPFIHLAGEHRYHLETAEKTMFQKEHERFN